MSVLTAATYGVLTGLVSFLPADLGQNRSYSSRGTTSRRDPRRIEPSLRGMGFSWSLERSSPPDLLSRLDFLLEKR